MKKIIISAYLSLILVGHITVMGQTGITNNFLQELKVLSDNYSKANFLSFNMTYRYADEQYPSVFLDSVQAMVKVQGKQFWCRMDSTECMSNEQYMVVLFAEDQLMYISKPAAQTNTLNPLSMLDTLLVKNTGMQTSVSIEKNKKKLQLIFPQGKLYKRIEYDIDIQTGLLSAMRSWVQAGQLYDPSVRDLLDQQSKYVMVETRFDNYRTTAFDVSCFDAHHYFQKKADSFEPTELYSLYKIFMGSPDLQ